jgi:polysaccharide export outer membrane protein
MVLSLVTGPGGGPVAVVSAQTPAQAPAKEYVLVAGDTVDINVFGEADLTRSVVIRPDGKISLPLVGEVQAAGFKPSQLAERIAEALKAYLRSPQVTVTVTGLQRLFVQVNGQAVRPGAIEIQRDWTLLDVIGSAGGVTPRANASKATLTRKDTTIAVDIARLLKGDKTANMAIEAGDIITIPLLQNRIAVMGYVRSAGAYDLDAGARLVDALAAAGGPTPGSAAVNRIGIVRLGADKKPFLARQADLNQIFKGDVAQNIELQDGDVVYVPQSGLVVWREVLSWLSGLSLIRALWPGLGI